MTANLARVYQSLPADQQAQACIFTENYGEASALTLLGKADHLPPVISGHNMYWYWGTGKCSGAVILAIGPTRSDLAQTFRSVRQVGLNTCSYCQPEENNLPIYLCTQPKVAIGGAWERARHLD